MPYCLAIGCSNKSFRKAKRQINIEKEKEITFHQFPKNESKKLAWIKAMGLCVESLPKFPHLCSLHFLESDIDRTSLMQTRLRENAIPIQDISELGGTKTTEFSPVSSQSSVEISLTESMHNDYLTSCTLQDNITNCKTKESGEIPIEISFETSVSNDELTLESETIKIETHHREEDDNDHNDNMLRREQPCSTSYVQPTNQRLEDTPRKKLLSKTLLCQKKCYQRQIRILKQKNKRQEKKIGHLVTMLKELKQICLKDLKEHLHDQNPLENHIHLTKPIACKYIKSISYW